MANVTRTIKVRTYTFGNVDTDTLQITNVSKIESPVKLGTRRLAEIAKEKGAALLNTSVSEVLWAMDIEDFYKWGHAKGSDDDDVDTVTDSEAEAEAEDGDD